MAEIVVSLVKTKLAQIAFAESSSLVQSQWQILDDISFIKNELSTMKAFLRVAENKSLRDDDVKLWVAQVRDEAYKVEDIVEEFHVRMLVLEDSRREATGCLDLNFCISHLIFLKNQFVLRHQFHSQILTVRRELKEISERRHRFNLEGSGTTSTSTNLEDERREGYHTASYPFEEEADIVGIGKGVKKLRKWLIDKCHHRLIVSVVGRGGLGKTTLVKKVFNDIKGKFDCDAWVFVSNDFKIQETLRDMLKRFYESRSEAGLNGVDAMTTYELSRNIHNYLQGKRYLLVFDDVWDIKVWEGIKHALPREGEGRVIFTTRLIAVASPIDESYYIHHMKALSQALPWNLFCRKAFRNHNPPGCCPQHLKQTGEALVEKCEGLPLAIVAIGGLMSKKSSSLSEWDEVLENLDWELNHNPDLEKLSGVFMTSYNYLPPSLKYCFLYCGMFPKNCEIETSRLIHMWVAEGIIENHSRKTVEEVANDYLSQLIERGFLQVKNYPWQLEVKACRMHDLMHDTAIHMLKKEEFGVVHKNQRDKVVFEGQRRVAIHSREVTVQQNMSDLNTRTFITFSETELQYDVLCYLLSNLKRLRVLDLSRTSIEHLPSDICNLVHLRYLSLRWTQVSELPTSLQDLYNLQTLDVRDTAVKIFPRGIQVAMLSQLRHLLLTSFKQVRIGVHLENSTIGPNNLVNLQTLWGVIANKSLVEQFEYSKDLRKLALKEVKGRHCTELCSHIMKMTHLRVLKIYSTPDEVLDLEPISQPPNNIEKLTLRATLKGLPKWISFLNCLRKVYLGENKLKEDPMSTLAKLPSLEVLTLRESYMGRKMSWGDGTEGRFPKLRALLMRAMPELEELSEIDDGTMQSLQFLEISDCPKLKKVPHGFQHLKAVKTFRVQNIHEDFIKRLRRCQLEGFENNSGEDHWMIQHIRFVWFRQTIDGKVITEKLPTFDN